MCACVNESNQIYTFMSGGSRSGKVAPKLGQMYTKLDKLSEFDNDLLPSALLLHTPSAATDNKIKSSKD